MEEQADVGTLWVLRATDYFCICTGSVVERERDTHKQRETEGMRELSKQRGEERKRGRERVGEDERGGMREESAGREREKTGDCERGNERGKRREREKEGERASCRTGPSCGGRAGDTGLGFLFSSTVRNRRLCQGMPPCQCRTAATRNPFKPDGRPERDGTQKDRAHTRASMSQCTSLTNLQSLRLFFGDNDHQKYERGKRSRPNAGS